MTRGQRHFCLFVLWGAFAVAMLVILNNVPVPDDIKVSVTLVLDLCAMGGTWLISRAGRLAPQEF